MPFFNINLRNIFKRPRTLPTQQAAETARDMAMNVVNRVNDNPQPGNLAPVRYEHIVGHLGANINTRPQPVAEELHEEQPVNQPVAQPVEKREELPAENNNVQQPQTARATQPVAEEDHNFSLQAYEASGEAQRARQRIRAALQRSQALEQRLSQPFIDSNIPAQPFVNSRNIPAQPFVNSSNIPAFQPAAQQNNPNPIFTVRHTLGTPGYNLENAPAMSRTFSAGTHVFTGYDPFNNQRIEIDTDLNNEDRLVFRNIPKVEISRGNQHYTFDNARVVRVKRSDSIDENDGQLHIDRNGNVRAKG